MYIIYSILLVCMSHTVFFYLKEGVDYFNLYQNVTTTLLEPVTTTSSLTPSTHMYIGIAAGIAGLGWGVKNIDYSLL